MIALLHVLLTVVTLVRWDVSSVLIPWNKSRTTAETAAFACNGLDSQTFTAVCLCLYVRYTPRYIFVWWMFCGGWLWVCAIQLKAPSAPLLYNRRKPEESIPECLERKKMWRKTTWDVLNRKPDTVAFFLVGPLAAGELTLTFVFFSSLSQTLNTSPGKESVQLGFIYINGSIVNIPPLRLVCIMCWCIAPLSLLLL